VNFSERQAKVLHMFPTTAIVHSAHTPPSQGACGIPRLITMLCACTPNGPRRMRSGMTFPLTSAHI